MIGLDTNVVVRYVMQDDEEQSARASALIESLSADSPGFISVVTVIELHWVLTSCYSFDGAQATRVVDGLLRTRQLVVDRAHDVLRASRTYSASASSKADFADCLIREISLSVGCHQIMTFDRAAARHAGMSLLA
jgi:predicted nucleic-acid-binding protein